MPSDETPNVTLLLAAVRQGDHSAESRLISIVYADLRRIARRYTRGERVGHTLDTTALVHEAYLRLMPSEGDFMNRVHFFAVAARIMRNLLVDRARSRRSGKKGGGAHMVDIENLQIGVELPVGDMLDLDEALLKLKEFAPRQEQIVELRFFSGMTEDEVAAHLGLSARTVRRDWNLAKAWLYRELKQRDIL